MSYYECQTRFVPFGEEGQQKLSSSQILIFSADALGSRIVDQLAHMEAHHVAVVDIDIAEISNLHRQTLFNGEGAHILISRVEVIKHKVNQIGINVNLAACGLEVTSSNIESLIRNVEPGIVIGGTDSFKVRYLISEVYHGCRTPWVYGTAVSSKGSVYRVDHRGPCLECLSRTISDIRESYAINGVIPPVMSMITSCEVAEAIRYLSGEGFSKQLITVDIFNTNYESIDIDTLRNEDCPMCEKREYTLLESQRERAIEDLCGSVYLFRFPSKIFKRVAHLPRNMVKSTSFAESIQYQTYRFTLFKNGRMDAYGIHNDEETHHLYNTLLEFIR